MAKTYPVSGPTKGTYNWFAQAVGLHLGYGANFNDYDHNQSSVVDLCIQRGLNLFYFPPVADPPKYGNGNPWQGWSFLTPAATISASSGDADYDLPTDFAGIIDGFTFGSGTAASRPIVQIDDMSIRTLKVTEAASNGEPRFFSVRPKTSTGSAIQAYEVVFYPTPGGSYTLTYRYQRNPPVIASSSTTYPFGFSSHAETIVAAMMAIADTLPDSEFKDGQPGPARGRQYERFMQLLSASVRADMGVSSGLTVSPWETTEPAYGTYGYFLREVGGYLFENWNPKSWSYEQDRMANAIVQAGIKRFYNGVLAGESNHDWSFLQINATLSLTNGDFDYDLPATFGTVASEFTLSAGSSARPLKMVDESEVRKLQASSNESGTPLYVAIRPKAVALTATQAWEAIFYPKPNDSFTVSYRYRASTVQADGTNLYPLGTDVHADTILASCLSVAELRKAKQRGACHEDYMERLAASIRIDQHSSRLKAS